MLQFSNAGQLYGWDTSVRPFVRAGVAADVLPVRSARQRPPGPGIREKHPACVDSRPDVPSFHGISGIPRGGVLRRIIE